MKKKILITLVLLVLATLVYFQIRTWKKFDWHSFREQTEGVNVGLILLGTGIIYFDYYLRALRWRILLRPVHQTKTSRLVAPTMIGFTALALLGRPGEFIRPFLIGRKEGLPMSSQLAVWVVERLFDMGAFALIMALNVILFADQLRELDGFQEHPSAFNIFKMSAFGLLLGVVVAAALALLMRRNPEGAARSVEKSLGRFSHRFAKALARRVHTFGEGLNTIHDTKSFVQIVVISLALWLTIGGAYFCVTHAYADIRPDMTLSSCFLLTGASVAGGTLQLPAVGGGSQLATIGTLVGVFGYSKELSISCGIMLWLVTFMSVIPAGLILAHLEHVSLTKAEKESLQEEQKVMEEG
jgi:glycosyltransferase 2 family protein